AYLVLASKRPDVQPGQVLERDQVDNGEGLRLRTGAAALEESLRKLDLSALADDLRRQLQQRSPGEGDSARRQQLLRRLRLVRSLSQGGVRPEWMIPRRLPVIGPALRPVVRLDSGRYASSELNDLYRRVISRNNRLRELLSRPTPASILQSE